jgi:hypothetical protein
LFKLALNIVIYNIKLIKNYFEKLILYIMAKLFFILYLFIPLIFFSQTKYNSTKNNLDKNSDGWLDSYTNNRIDYDGSDVLKTPPADVLKNKNLGLQHDTPYNFDFSQFWVSPSGAFTNVNDAAAGYFEGDTLLCIACYTFNPNKFYIWKQVQTKPDSFALIYTYTKAEFGGFGPIAVGDIDGDGKIDIAAADYSTLSRIYVFSNTGIGTWTSRETQNALTHPADNNSAMALLIGDLNKNGQKEIICLRGWSSPTSGMVRIWEHTGGPGTYNFTNLFTYTTVSYVFGQGGIGDSDGNGWDEVFITYGGYDQYNTNIRKIQYDSASGTFQHQMFTAPAIGLPISYKIADVNNNGTKELICSQSSNGKAAVYIYKSTGPNQYVTLDSIFEPSDPNTMLTCDVKLLTGETYSAIIAASYGSVVYVYEYYGTSFVKQYQNSNYTGPAIRRIAWLPWTGYDGYMNSWGSTNSNGNVYLFKRNMPSGILSNRNIAEGFKLEQNYPNPFNPSTVINFTIGKSTHLSLEVYDITGKLIEMPINQYMNNGNYSIQFNGQNLPSGVYYYKIEAGDRTDTKKMVLIK